MLAQVCRELGLALDDPGPSARRARAVYGHRAVIVDPSVESITTTIRQTDLVVSIVSTGLIEAVVLGKPSRVLAIHPRWSRYRRAFVADPLFGPIHDVEQLRAALADMAAGVDPKLTGAAAPWPRPVCRRDRRRRNPEDRGSHRRHRVTIDRALPGSGTAGEVHLLPSRHHDVVENPPGRPPGGR